MEYKLLFRKTWDETTQEGKDRRHEDYEDCHRRCAVRLREVLKKNGGIYIKVSESYLSGTERVECTPMRCFRTDD